MSNGGMEKERKKDMPGYNVDNRIKSKNECPPSHGTPTSPALYQGLDGISHIQNPPLFNSKFLPDRNGRLLLHASSATGFGSFINEARCFDRSWS